MTSDMVKPEKSCHLHLIYDFAVPLSKPDLQWKLCTGNWEYCGGLYQSNVAESTTYCFTVF